LRERLGRVRVGQHTASLERVTGQSSERGMLLFRERQRGKLMWGYYEWWSEA